MNLAPTPDFDDWLVGQCHRCDLVGTLARLRVSAAPMIIEVGLDTWLATLIEGRVLNPAVEDARKEYAQCVHELRTTGHSESFPILYRTFNEDRLAALFAKHQAEPDKTPQSYLHELHKQLRKDVERRTRLYLDTNHWINLVNVALKLSKARAPYDALLGKLRALSAQNKIICPLSYPLFHELLTQSDPTTRRPMADLIDELSSGVCLQPPNQIERIELKRQILSSVLGPGAPDVGEWIWTKAAAVCGEWLVQPQSETPPGADVAAIQKLMVDEMWHRPLAALTEFPGYLPNDGLQTIAHSFGAEAEAYRASGISFERVRMEYKHHFGQKLFEDALAKMRDEVVNQFPNECAKYQASGGGAQKFDPTVPASIQIKAGIFASFVMSTRTKKEFDVNDLLDALHVSVALPYVNAVCVDGGMAHRLKSRPLQFDQVYRCRVFSTPEELLKWLDTLLS